MAVSLLWFRRDLRLTDNPALVRAMESGRVIPVYIHAPDEEEPWTPGGAGRWWLHHSLSALGRDLQARGSRLVIRHGPTLPALHNLIRETGAGAVFWNRLYEPALITRDRAIKTALREAGVHGQSCNAALLHEPWSVIRQNGNPYRVFTPFWKACLALGLPTDVQPAPGHIPGPDSLPRGHEPDDLNLLPRSGWDVALTGHWQPGEAGALARLRSFLQESVCHYDEMRNHPGHDGSSRLSPHLHFGEIGPRQVAAACEIIRSGLRNKAACKSLDTFLREIGWREFAHHLLYHYPHTDTLPLDNRFKAFPWAEPDMETLTAWRQGRTGVPLVDAGMRELWKTGWMHNRVRMIVASFLTKNLRIHWLEGARWFWDTLVDADLASNTLGWQWTAGCGADAAPYFRIFNPVLQGERFDPDGDYVRRWVPELAGMPARYIHRPWEAPLSIRETAGVRLGSTYPQSLTDLALSRRQALDAWDRIKAGPA